MVAVDKEKNLNLLNPDASELSSNRGSFVHTGFSRFLGRSGRVNSSGPARGVYDKGNYFG